MVLHKQLRVLKRGTPCAIIVLDDSGGGICAYHGASDEILERLTKIKNVYRNSFVREVKLVDESDVSFEDYDMNCKSFIEIRVKCKEAI